jgi:hypothetical protein
MRFSMTLRSSIVVAGLAVAAVAHAGNTTINTTALVANSVQAFSTKASSALKLTSSIVTPLGTASTVTGATLASYALPITSITVDSKLQIVSGDSKGAALEISRVLEDGTKVGVLLANFTLDYANKKVLADRTILGEATVKQAAIYNFNVNTALSIKYKFPLSINAHEVLDKLFLTPETRDAFLAGLQLDDFLVATLDSTDWGTLTQDVSVKFRPKAVSNKPYVVAQPVAQPAAQ